MTYLVFVTYKSAYGANAIISLNMRLGGDSTVQWADVLTRKDGKFCFPKPDDAMMEYVSNFTEEIYDASWFEEVVV